MFEENEMKRFREHNFMIAEFMVRGYEKKPKEEHDE
jgi:hypothetical protein